MGDQEMGWQIWKELGGGTKNDKNMAYEIIKVPVKIYIFKNKIM